MASCSSAKMVLLNPEHWHNNTSNAIFIFSCWGRQQQKKLRGSELNGRGKKGSFNYTCSIYSHMKPSDVEKDVATQPDSDYYLRGHMPKQVRICRCYLQQSVVFYKPSHVLLCNILICEARLQLSGLFGLDEHYRHFWNEVRLNDLEIIGSGIQRRVLNMLGPKRQHGETIKQFKSKY